MRRKFAIFVLATEALVLGLVAAYRFLPKRYALGERLTQATIFWNDKEAFLFLNTSTAGRTQNFVLDKLGKTRYGLWALFFGGGLRFMGTGISGYHVLPAGELKQLSLPPEVKKTPTSQLSIMLGIPRKRPPAICRGRFDFEIGLG